MFALVLALHVSSFVAFADRPPPYIPPEPSEEEKDIFLSMQKGINFDKYDKIPVECTGRDAPREGIHRYVRPHPL